MKLVMLRGVLVGLVQRLRSWKVLLVVAPFLFLLSTVNYVEQGQAGLVWKPIMGEVSLQEKPGFYFTSPFTLVSTIELRPQRVCLTSAAHSAPNCRLIQFDPKQYKEFVKVEGWSYYWFANRISFNLGHPETYRGFRDILRGYAFSAHQYPFIKTLKYQ